MTTDESKVQEIFFGALKEESREEVAAYLDHACQGDIGLRQRVQRLLDAKPKLGRFLQANAGDLVATTDQDQLFAEKPGAQIGPYKIREQIGEGGFGAVYVAEQHKPVSRKVALKIIKPGMDSKNIIARFEAERQALAMMDHPNIAKVLDAGATESGRPYFVMDLVHGLPITEFCDDQKLTNRERLELFVQVCHAVQHAHQKGIIHRDLKPSNIMVTMLDDKPVPKVIDFGVAKALSHRLTDDTVYTAYGQMVGTPLYMSPEQTQMSGLDVDTRSDIYSLGVLLYELMTGSAPFDKDAFKRAEFDEVRRMIREDEPPRPSARVSTLDAESRSTVATRRGIDPRGLAQFCRGDLDWIVMKALEKDRIRRYETVNDFATDIHRHLNHEPVEACPPSAAYQLRKFARRNKASLVTLSLVAAALVLGMIGTSWQALQAEGARDEAVREKVETQRQLRKATALRLAGQAQLLKERRPVHSALLAIESIEATRRHGEGVLPSAHESLRASLSVLGGRPLLSGEAPVSVGISPSGRWMATGSQSRTGRAVRLWDLERPWHASVLLSGQKQTIGDVHAVSSDGRWIVTYAEGQQGKPQPVHLWDTTARDPLIVLEGHNDRVVHSIFSADSRWLVTGSDAEDTVRLYDLGATDVSGSVKVLGPGVRNWSMAISPDSRWLATAGREGYGHLWDLNRDDPAGEVVLLPLGDQELQVRSLAFGPTGRWLATASGTYRDLRWTVRLWDLSADNPAENPLALPGHRHVVNAVEFSSDGRWLVSAGSDRTAQIWDLHSEMPVESRVVLRRHTGEIYDVAISSDSQWLLTAADDYTVRLWNLLAEDPSAASLVLSGHERPVWFTAFNSDGTWAITRSRDGVLRVWDLADQRTDLLTEHGPAAQSFATGVSRRILHGHTDLVLRTQFLSDGNLLTVSLEGVGRLWKASLDNSFVNIGEFSGGEMLHLLSHSVSPSERWLAIGNMQGLIHLWDLQSRDPELSHRVLQSKNSSVRRLAFSADDRWLTIVSEDQTLELWDLHRANLATPVSLRAPDDRFGSILVTSDDVVMSPGGHWLAAPAGKTMLLWNLSTSDPAATRVSLAGHDENIIRAHFSPDGRWLATGSADHTVRLWNLKGADSTGQPFVLREHEQPVEEMAFSRDCRYLITSCKTPDGWQSTVRLWDLTDDNFVTKPIVLPRSRLIRNSVHALRNPVGSLLVLASDHAVRVYDLQSSDPAIPLRTLRGPASAPGRFAISPDGRWLAAGGEFESQRDIIRLWDLKDETTIQPHEVLSGEPSEMWAMTFTPDSQALVTGHLDGHVRVWDLSIEALIELGRQTAGRELTVEERGEYGLE